MIDLIPLSEPCKVNDMPAINEEGVAYVITNSGNSNEYYILENRQQVTFGTYNGGHGLMVWHIDYNKTAWENNEVNAVKSHQRMTFLPADGQVGVLSGSADEGYYYDITAEDEAGDPYPGRQNVTEVKPLTWFTAENKGTKTHANLIKQIAETADGKISFVYGDYSPLDTPEVTEPTDVSPDYFTANWLPVEGATSYTLQVKTSNGEAEPTVLLEEDFSGFSSVKDNVEVKNMDRLRRKIDQYLIEWKNSNNKLPLIIKGARQIGKTNAIRNFGKNFLKKKELIYLYCHKYKRPPNPFFFFA